MKPHLVIAAGLFATLSHGLEPTVEKSTADVRIVVFSPERSDYDLFVAGVDESPTDGFLDWYAAFEIPHSITEGTRSVPRGRLTDKAVVWGRWPDAQSNTGEAFLLFSVDGLLSVKTGHEPLRIRGSAGSIAIDGQLNLAIRRVEPFLIPMAELDSFPSETFSVRTLQDTSNGLGSQRFCNSGGPGARDCSITCAPAYPIGAPPTGCGGISCRPGFYACCSCPNNCDCIPDDLWGGPYCGGHASHGALCSQFEIGLGR